MAPLTGFVQAGAGGGPVTVGESDVAVLPSASSRAGAGARAGEAPPEPIAG